MFSIVILVCLGFIGYWSGKTIRLHETTKTHDVLISTTAVEDIRYSQRSFFDEIYSTRVCLSGDVADQIDPDILKLTELNLTVQDSSLEESNGTWNIAIKNVWKRQFFSFYWLEGTTFTFNVNISTIDNRNENFTLLLFDIPGEDIAKDHACDSRYDNYRENPLCAFNPEECSGKNGTYNCSCNYTVNSTDTYFLCLIEAESRLETASYEFKIRQPYYNVTASPVQCNLSNAMVKCCVDYGHIFTKLEHHPRIVVSTNVSALHYRESAGFPMFIHIDVNIETDVVFYLVGVSILCVLVILMLVFFFWLTRHKHLHEDLNYDCYCCCHIYGT